MKVYKLPKSQAGAERQYNAIMRRARRALAGGLAFGLDCIDWDRAARELQMDYTAVEFDGVTYWVR